VSYCLFALSVLKPDMASLLNCKFGYASTLWFTIIVTVQFISADVSRNIVYFNSKFVCEMHILFDYFRKKCCLRKK